MKSISFILLFCAQLGIAHAGPGGFEHIMKVDDNTLYYKRFNSGIEIQEEGWKVNNRKENWWISYHTNGKIASQGNYRNNHKNGYWYEYHPSGKIKSEGHFFEGKKTGFWKEFNENGQLVFEGNFDTNELHGYAKYYVEGFLIKEGWYNRNSPCSYWRIYDEKGNFSHAIKYSEI